MSKTKIISKTDIILDDLSVSVNDISRAVIDLQSCFSALRAELAKVPTPKVKKVVKVKKTPESEVPEAPKISLKGKVSYKDNLLSIEQIPKTSNVEITYIKNPKKGIVINKSTLLSLFNKLPLKFTPDDIKELVKKSPKIDDNNLKTPYLITWFFILIFHKNCKKISGKKDKLKVHKF